MELRVLRLSDDSLCFPRVFSLHSSLLEDQIPIDVRDVVALLLSVVTCCALLVSSDLSFKLIYSLPLAFHAYILKVNPTIFLFS